MVERVVPGEKLDEDDLLKKFTELDKDIESLWDLFGQHESQVIDENFNPHDLFMDLYSRCGNWIYKLDPKSPDHSKLDKSGLESASNEYEILLEHFNDLRTELHGKIDNIGSNSANNPENPASDKLQPKPLDFHGIFSVDNTSDDDLLVPMDLSDPSWTDSDSDSDSTPLQNEERERLKTELDALWNEIVKLQKDLKYASRFDKKCTGLMKDLDDAKEHCILVASQLAGDNLHIATVNYDSAQRIYDRVYGESRKRYGQHYMNSRKNTFISGSLNEEKLKNLQEAIGEDKKQLIKYEDDIKQKVDDKKYYDKEISDLDAKFRRSTNEDEKKSLEYEIRRLQTLCKKNDDELDNIKNERKKTNDSISKRDKEHADLSKGNHRMKDIAGSIEHMIDTGHSDDSALNLAQRRYDLNNENLEKFDHFAREHESHRSDKGHSRWGNRGSVLKLIGASKRVGRGYTGWRIGKVMGELKGLEQKEKSLLDEQSGDPENFPKYKQESLHDIQKKISEVEKKIEIYEEHPEAFERWGKRGVKFGKGVKEGAGEVVNGAVDRYSKHRAQVIGWISFACAFLILIILLYMKVLAGAEYIPVSGWQIGVFMIFAILLEVIKSSLGADNAGRNEAREIIFILAVLALIITAAIRDKAAVGFWTSLIFCAIISLYLLLDFYTDSALVSIVLAFVMMAVISFTAAGWMDELGVQTEKLAVQTGFAEAIETSINAVSDGVSDVWLMITDPNGWYARKEMEQSAQKGEGETDRAVEITTAKITPSIVNLGDEINVLVKVENFGKNDANRPANEVEISLKKVGNHQTHFKLEGSYDEDAEVVRYMGNLMPATGAQEVFEVTAPPAPPDLGACIATFKMEASVSYRYDVDAMGNIYIIGKDRYDELVKQDKLVPKKQVTKSTSGPVSVSIMTNLPQPIAVEDGREFSIHFGIVNTRASSGTVNVTGVDIAIPEQFKVVEGGTCKLCRFEKEGNPIVRNGFVHYSFKGLYDGEPDVCPSIPEDDLRGQTDKSMLVEGESKIFKCEMKYVSDGEGPSFEKPMDVGVKVDYVYEYSRDVSFTVRKRDIDLETDIARCS